MVLVGIVAITSAFWFFRISYRHLVSSGLIVLVIATVTMLLGLESESNLIIDMAYLLLISGVVTAIVNLVYERKAKPDTPRILARISKRLLLRIRDRKRKLPQREDPTTAMAGKMAHRRDHRGRRIAVLERTVTLVRERLIEAFGAKAYTNLERRGFTHYALGEDVNLGRGLLERILASLPQVVAPPGFLIGRLYRLVTTERVVEVPFVRRHLEMLSIPSTVLEFGPGVSNIAYELARKGHQVATVDFRVYPYRHRNLAAIRGDFLVVPLDAESFDCVYSISAIEHIGLEQYGSQGPRMSLDQGGDHEVVERIHGLLKPGGLFIFSVPFGKRGWTPSQRVYDDLMLGDLVAHFDVKEMAFYKRVGTTRWVHVDSELLRDVDSATPEETRGVVLLKCVKKGSASRR